MARYILSDIAEEISVRENNPSSCQYDKFVGLEHYETGEIEIHNFGRTNNLVSAMKVFQSGDILGARRNVYLKRASVVNFAGLTSGDSIILRAKNPTHARILPFILNTESFWDYADKYADGTMSKRLSPKTLFNYEFELPSLEKQKELAEILWAAEETKQSYKKLLQKTEELAKSRFLEMFESIDLSKVKSNWIALEELTTIYTGTTPSTSEDDNWNGDIPWITPAEMTKDTFYVNDTVRKITEKGRKSKSLEIMPINTVLLSTRAPIGKVGITNIPMTCNQGFKNFECGNKLNPIFLYVLLKENTAYLNSLGSGTTFLELSKSKIAKTKIPVPPIELQNTFAEFIQELDKSKFRLQQTLDSLNATMRALINENLK